MKNKNEFEKPRKLLNQSLEMKQSSHFGLHDVNCDCKGMELRLEMLNNVKGGALFMYRS